MPKLNLTDTSKNPDSIIFDKPYIAAAEQSVKEFTYGDMIEKSWLFKNFNMNQLTTGTREEFEAFSFEFLQNIEGFKEYLLETHQRLLVCQRGKGYIILPPKSQSDYAMTNLKTKVSAEINKAVKALTHINENMLSYADIKKRDEQAGKVAALAAFSKTRIGNK
jgi:hypothetical protein